MFPLIEVGWSGAVSAANRGADAVLLVLLCSSAGMVAASTLSPMCMNDSKTHARAMYALA